MNVVIGRVEECIMKTLAETSIRIGLKGDRLQESDMDDFIRADKGDSA